MILALAAALAMPSVAELRDHRRVLVVIAPNDRDVRRMEQQDGILDVLRQLDDRDVTLVDVTGTDVRGATDDAVSLRRRWHVGRDSFAVLLIGKDGRVALRSPTPVPGRTILAAIDAMPMRRAGLR